MVCKKGMRIAAAVLVFLLMIPPGLMAQQGAEGPPPIFSQEQLDQMLAPIALYPDDLLIQMLMAATYPLEIVQAARWVKANPNLQGDSLAIALETQNWGPSVKSLVAFPQVLAMMDDHLGWTQQLGDAFLAQKDQVMDTIQRLRAKAQAEGTLQNTNEQRVIVEDRVIVIEPVSPQVVYVPIYNPAVVYGPWWYPAYPPYHYYPAGVIIKRNVAVFGLGVAVGVAWGYAWGGFHWSHHDVVININKNIHYNNRIDRARYAKRVGEGGRGVWEHNAIHRKGVAYRNQATAQRFRQQRPGVQERRDYRGLEGAKERPGQPPERRVAGQKGREGPLIQPPKAAAPPGRQVSQPKSNAFEGFEHGGTTKQFSNRGHQSIASAPSGKGPSSSKAPAARSVGGGFSRGNQGGHK
jgi:hypothetical protein